MSILATVPTYYSNHFHAIIQEAIHADHTITLKLFKIKLHREKKKNISLKPLPHTVH